jgi:Sulfotransferase family
MRGLLAVRAARVLGDSRTRSAKHEAARMPPAPVPFVVGSSRSGTTLLRLMLDSHPELAIPAETQFYAGVLEVDERRGDWLDAVLAAMVTNHSWDDFGIGAAEFERAVRASAPAGPGDVLRAFYRIYAARFGKPRWGDKWPGNVLRMTAIARILPEARFVHIIRDGRDVAASLREMWWRPGDSYEACIELWAGRIRAARAQAATGIPYLEVRYESLVRAPRETLAQVCAFAELRYDEAMLDYARRAPARLAELAEWTIGDRRIPSADRVLPHAKTRLPLDEDAIGRWRAEMSAADVAACERAAGDLLAELGYR